MHNCMLVRCVSHPHGRKVFISGSASAVSEGGLQVGPCDVELDSAMIFSCTQESSFTGKNVFSQELIISFVGA